MDRVTQAFGWLSTRAGRTAVMTLVGVVALWFTLPAFFVAYTEGFQPQIVLNADALWRGDVRLGDTLYPFNGQFFLLTRLGMSLAMAGLQHAGDLTGLAAFRIINLVSLVVLVGSLVALLWHIYRAGPALSLLCCLLFPPIFESSYIPNDNMPSAALACLALVLFWTNPTISRMVVTGLLLGCAVLFRLDAALIAPAFAILLLTEVEGWGRRAVRACIAAALVVAVPVLVYRLCGLSFLDTFAAVSRATVLWDKPSQALFNDARTLFRSVTVFGGLAWLLGVASFARSRRWRELGLSVAVPVLYMVAYGSQLGEGRYLLPLSPFFLIAAVEGLRSVVSLPARLRTAALAVLAVGFAIWIVPPPPMLKGSMITDDEGPRLVLGRAWNPLSTLWWQGRLRAGQAAVETEIERVAASPDPIIVTGYWTGDRLTALMLLEHGFAISAGNLPEACRGIAETWVRGPTRLLQVRTHIPLFRLQNESTTWNQAGLPCVRAAGPGRTHVLIVNAGSMDGHAAKFDAPGVVFSAAQGRPPPLAPRMVSVLPGVSLAVLPVAGVSASLEAPATPEDRQAALDALARRADALR